MARDRPKKVALIGATGYEYRSPEARVESFPWDKLKKDTNLADYDVVILNLLSIEDPKALDAQVLQRVLNVRTVLEVLAIGPGHTDNAVYVLGDPRFDLIEVGFRCTEAFQGEVRFPFLYWSGLKFEWDNRPGDTVECERKATSGRFNMLVDKLGPWRYSLEKCRVDSDRLNEHLPMAGIGEDGFELAAHVEDICTSRYQTSIVFSVRVAVKKPTPKKRGPGVRVISEDIVPLTEPIYFLPESKLSQRETLEFVLRDLCGVEVSAPEPEWISEFAAPGQEEVDRELAQLEDRMREMLQEQELKVKERMEVREPLKLLYETGAALEESARFVLEALGAEVEWPPKGERNNEDGWVTVQVGDEILEGVLEVKGIKNKHFGLEGLRQLTDWIERGRTFRRKTYTGIFVGNSAREDPPRRRIWPFDKNWVEQAEMRGYAAIRTEDLYILYLLHRTERLDRDVFWRELFSTKGPFDMSSYRKKLTDEEKDQLENLPRG